MMNWPLLSPHSRVMLFAPHPDDEALATGVFLQRAVAAGAAVRVIYATNGERNGWPQRVLEGRVRLRENDRRRWGARRQGEAHAALRTLGIGTEQVEFLSLPDQGVTNLLLESCEETVRSLRRHVSEWAPTHLLLPSTVDTHPDHSGLALLLGIALEGERPRCTRLHYLVHGRNASFAHQARSLASLPWELLLKRRAILCHATQVALSRRRFLSYARRPERFVVSPMKSSPFGNGLIRSCRRTAAELILRVAFSFRPLRAEEIALYLIGYDSLGKVRRLRAALPRRRGQIDLVDAATGQPAGPGRYDGDGFKAELSLPANGFAPERPVFLKLDRRIWFFDEAGWLELGPALAQAAAPQMLPAAATELAVA